MIDIKDSMGKVSILCLKHYLGWFWIKGAIVSILRAWEEVL